MYVQKMVDNDPSLFYMKLCYVIMVPHYLINQCYFLEFVVSELGCFILSVCTDNILYFSGYGEIHAVNVREMIFIMIYVSFDMILGAYLLGNMAALIVKGSKTEKFRDKMADIIKYMNKSKLDRNITKQIKGHLRLQYERHNAEVDLLQDIPASIRTKVSINFIFHWFSSYSW